MEMPLYFATEPFEAFSHLSAFRRMLKKMVPRLFVFLVRSLVLWLSKSCFKKRIGLGLSIRIIGKDELTVKGDAKQ